MVHSYSKIQDLCYKYGFLRTGWSSDRVFVCLGERGMGVILTSEDWEVIEKRVVELAMRDAFDP